MNAQQVLIEKLSNYFERSITLKRNEYLVSKGIISTDIYLIETGSLHIFIEDETEQHSIRFGYKNSIITALDSFISNSTTSFYIQALKKSTVKVVSKAGYDKFLNASKENQELWSMVQQNLIYQQLEREIDLITYSPQKRFERVLKRSPQLFQEIPKKYIASYLRMTPETLSRILKNLD